MKHSIARKVTRRVSLLLLIAAALLFLGAYHTVSGIVTKENRRYAQAILGVYADLLADESEQNGIPIDLDHTDNIIRYGEYLCEWYSVDSAYVYVPDPAAGTVTYLGASFQDYQVPDAPVDHMIGHTVDYVLTPGELAVWNETALFAQLETDRYGREISTVMRVSDAFGNRALAGIDIAYANVTNKILRSFAILALVIAAVTAGVYYAVYRIIRKKVSEPAQLLSRSMQEFITDGRRSEAKLAADGGDEYSMMAEAFNRMSDNIDSYEANIHALIREQTARQAELDIAGKIQRGFLPKEQMETPDWVIHASMTPASDVGGDFYDYLPLDDHRVLLVIADVSGKGISAAMFMSVTLTLIRQYARMGLAPDEILRRTNDTLAENNAAMLFATVFAGIYDSSTGTFTYANAGHNLPYLICGTLQKLDGAAGTLLGLFKGEDYHCAAVQLRPGDTLLFYTDGVNEAVNAERCFFGEQRLEQTLRAYRASGEENPVTYVENAVSRFSEGAEQHDDITVLALTAKRTVTLELDFEMQEFEKIKAEVLRLPISRQQQLNLCLAAEERFANLCAYAFRDGVPAGEKIGFTLTVENQIELCFADGGQPHDPLENVTAPEDYDIDIQIGGLGKLLSISMTDDAKYEYRDGKNILTLIKYFEEGNQ